MHVLAHPIEAALASKLAAIRPSLAVVLPNGRRIGAADSAVTMRVHDAATLALLASGQIGLAGEAYVEGRLDLEGRMRDLCDVALGLLDRDPSSRGVADTSALLRWCGQLVRYGKSLAKHTVEADARQAEFHYDLNGAGSDDFYGLWLDPRRVYSCAYYRLPDLTLEQAQAAKLDLVCRKLMLQPGDRLLDVGAGWGALLFWAAEHYGVRAHGVTLSKHQHAYVTRELAHRRLSDRVSIDLQDYRAIDERRPFDKIASIGMVEHVGLAQLATYFAKLRRLLAPGGLLLNHGITAAKTRHAGLGTGMSGFIDRYIFPGGELQHVATVLSSLADAGLEMVDVENLRPHYARTLWAWSDAFESRLDDARRLSSDAVVRAYRLYLGGSAMAFERGWIAIHQTLAIRPDGRMASGPMRGAQSTYPFTRDHLAAPRDDLHLPIQSRGRPHHARPEWRSGHGTLRPHAVGQGHLRSA